jgi:hypothetical protein
MLAQGLGGNACSGGSTGLGCRNDHPTGKNGITRNPAGLLGAAVITEFRFPNSRRAASGSDDMAFHLLYAPGGRSKLQRQLQFETIAFHVWPTGTARSRS